MTFVEPLGAMFTDVGDSEHDRMYPVQAVETIKLAPFAERLKTVNVC